MLVVFNYFCFFSMELFDFCLALLAPHMKKKIPLYFSNEILLGIVFKNKLNILCIAEVQPILLPKNVNKKKEKKNHSSSLGHGDFC